MSTPKKDTGELNQGLADSIGVFAELVAAPTPTPGGGSVSAYSGLLAAALGQMVCNLTIGKKKYAEVEPRLKEIKAELERLGSRLRQLIAEDAASFEAVIAAYRLPKETEAQAADRENTIQNALRGAVDVPYDTGARAFEVLRMLAEIGKIGNPNAFSDIAVAAQLAQTAIKGAYYNVGINLSSIADRAAAEHLGQGIARIAAEAETLAKEIEAVMISYM